MLKKIWNDEAGVIISAELVLVLTIAVLAMVVGLSEVATAVNTELNDLSNAFGALNQTYSITGFSGADSTGNHKVKSVTSGSAFNDTIDDCDTNSTCDIVVGASSNAVGG